MKVQNLHDITLQLLRSQDLDQSLQLENDLRKEMVFNRMYKKTKPVSQKRALLLKKTLARVLTVRNQNFNNQKTQGK